MTERTAENQVKNEPPVNPAEPVSSISMEAQLAVSRANDLLLQALTAQDTACRHLTDDTRDVEDSNNTVAQARQTLQQCQEALRNPRRGSMSDINQRLANLSLIVAHTTEEVAEHETETAQTSVKRTQAHMAEKKAESRHTPTPTRRRRAPDANERHPHARNGQQGQGSSSDAHGEGPAQAPGHAPASGMPGSIRRIAQSALDVIPYVPNPLSIVLGPFALVRNTALGAINRWRGGGSEQGSVVGSAMGHMIGDQLGIVADARAGTTRLGRELLPLLRNFQSPGNLRIFDTDHDGKAELHEIVARFRSAGIGAIHNVDGGGISIADVVHTWNTRNTPHRH